MAHIILWLSNVIDCFLNDIDGGIFFMKGFTCLGWPMRHTFTSSSLRLICCKRKKLFLLQEKKKTVLEFILNELLPYILLAVTKLFLSSSITSWYRAKTSSVAFARSYEFNFKMSGLQLLEDTQNRRTTVYHWVSTLCIAIEIILCETPFVFERERERRCGGWWVKQMCVNEKRNE